MRPLLLLPVWSPFLLGYYRSGGTWDSRLFLPLLMVTALGGGVFVLNQIFDIESDRENRKLFILPDGLVTLRAAWIQFIILDIIAVFLGFFLGIQVGIAIVIGVIFGILYSASPFSLKNKATTALLLNGLGHGTLMFIIGWLINSDFSKTAIILSIPYFFAFAGVYSATTIPDTEGDNAAGKKTIAVKLGKKFAGILVILLVIVATLLGYIFWEFEMIITGIIAMIAYLVSIFAGLKAYLISNKIIVLVFTLITAYLFKPYFIVALTMILFTLLYNKLRLKVGLL
ncbi:UbiA family prenyltransferase [bacterium]|nr:UbiA family prenyltransferase [bacterium]